MRTAIETLRVNLGIPTFNRVHTLERALRSALVQTHSNLEIVISDNASTDDTEELCRAIAAQDQRVRYVRQLRNIGPTANFNVLFAACRSPYTLLLADDDWLEPDYVEHCLSALREQPGCVAAGGRERYWRGDTMLTKLGLNMQLLQRNGHERVRTHYRSIGDGKGETNTFYSVMPAEVMRRATPMPNVLGNDVLVTARVVFQGYVRTLDDVYLNRSVGGTSVSMESIVTALDLAPWQARVPNLVMAAHVLGDVGWRHAIYATLPRALRLRWGVRCALSAIDWKSLAWHLSVPTAMALGQRPRGRWAWLTYQRLVRALGAHAETDRL